MNESLPTLPEIVESDRPSPRFVELQGSMSISLKMSATVTLDFFNAVESMLDTVDSNASFKGVSDNVNTIRLFIEKLKGSKLTLKNVFSFIRKFISLLAEISTILGFMQGAGLIEPVGPTIQLIIQRVLDCWSNIQSTGTSEEFYAALAELTKYVQAFEEFIKLLNKVK